MTEFDFDELDRAVNSLMNKTPSENDDTSSSSSTARSQPRSDVSSRAQNVERSETKTNFASNPSSVLAIGDQVQKQPQYTQQDQSRIAPSQSSTPESTKSSLRASPEPVATPSVASSAPVAAPMSQAVEQPQSNPSQNISRMNRSTSSPVTNRPKGDGALAQKRRGNFMDVVHPSSNMRPKLPAPASRAVSRESATISPPDQPSLESTPDTDRQQGSDQPRSAVRQQPPVQPVTPRQIDDMTLTSTLSDVSAQELSRSPSAEAASMEKLDPRRQLSTSSKPIAQASPSNTSNPVAQKHSFQPQSSTDGRSPIASELVDSLFIQDAKVEKRPLGLTPQETESMTLEQLSSVSTAENNDKNTTLPPELSQKMMNVESEDTTKTIANTATQQPQSKTPQAQSLKTTASPQASAPPSTISSSIPQQYQQQKRVDSDDEDQPAIYDPAYYKQEVKPSVEKKKSGWWVVIAIAGIIVLGGAGGVLYYLYSTGAF